jgi:hypothetical protein
MISFIKENNWTPTKFRYSWGWGNGYVVIPKGHPLHGLHYLKIQVDVVGGLTFAKSVEDIKAIWKWEELPKGTEGGWVVGFDTDNYPDWDKKKVKEETEKLKQQLMEYPLLK